MSYFCDTGFGVWFKICAVRMITSLIRLINYLFEKLLNWFENYAKL